MISDKQPNDVQDPNGFSTLQLDNYLTLSDEALIELIMRIKRDPNFNPENLNLQNYKLSDKGLNLLRQELPNLPRVQSIQLPKQLENTKAVQTIQLILKQRYEAHQLKLGISPQYRPHYDQRPTIAG